MDDLHHKTPTQYLFTSDSEPGRIYKLTLDGNIGGIFALEAATGSAFTAGAATVVVLIGEVVLNKPGEQRKRAHPIN